MRVGAVELNTAISNFAGGNNSEWAVPSFEQLVMQSFRLRSFELPLSLLDDSKLLFWRVDSLREVIIMAIRSFRRQLLNSYPPAIIPR